SFLLRTSRGTVAWAVLAGMAGGASTAGLIALIHLRLVDDQPTADSLIWVFAGLCLVVVFTRFVTQVSMVCLAQRTVFHLCTYLSRKILALPLRHLEDMGPRSVLAVLTQDILVVANAFVGIPLLCINLPVVVCCLAYLGWLSIAVLLSVV